MHQMMSQMQKMMNGGGGKRKWGDKQPESEHPKNQLLHGLSCLLGRTLTKADTEVTYEENEGQCRATVNITEKAVSYMGDFISSGNKKEAEKSAFQAALDAMKEELEVAKEGHKATKKAKNDAWKAERDAKKAAEGK